MASTGEVWKLGHRPALDGARGVAILLVLVCHSQVPGLTSAGPVGVTLFFALSGFLITALMLDEHARTGRLDLASFYLRRARRLLPALVVLLAVMAAIGVAGWRDVVAVGLYVGNWAQALRVHDLGALTGTWSLAVEEQFYALWPLAFVALIARGQRFAGGAILTLIAGAVAWHAWLVLHGAPPDRIYYGADTHAIPLLLGCLVAFRLHGASVQAGSGRGIRGWVLVTLGCALIPATFAWTWTASLAAVPAAATVYFVSRGGGVAVLEHPLLRWFGRRAYGLYLWNCPVAWWLARTELPWPVAAVILLGTSVPAAALSWRWVEEPFLRRGSVRPDVLDGELHRVR